MISVQEDSLENLIENLIEERIIKLKLNMVQRVFLILFCGTIVFMAASGLVEMIIFVAVPFFGVIFLIFSGEIRKKE